MAEAIVQLKGSVRQTFLQPAQRWSKGPGFKEIGKLEAILATAFAETQTLVHVMTGSLKLSGTTETDYVASTGVWTGQLSYGGASAGPIDPVDYAIYEMARGGAHDFFAGLPGHEVAFKDAINSFFTEDPL